MTFGGLTGDARLRASQVPIRGDDTADDFASTLTIDQSHLVDLSANLSGVPITDVQIARPDVRCIAQCRPEPFVLEAVSLGSDSLTFRFGATDVPLTAQALSSFGSCAG